VELFIPLLDFTLYTILKMPRPSNPRRAFYNICKSLHINLAMLYRHVQTDQGNIKWTCSYIDVEVKSPMDFQINSVLCRR